MPAKVFDPARLAAVRDSGLLDTPADEAFDRLARLAATLLEAPYAFITLVDETRSFWLSCIGIDATDPAERQGPVEESFCQDVIADGEPLIVGDTASDPRTAAHASNTSMGAAAWAGYPLLSPQGHVLGSFCVIDTVVREWSERDIVVLETLAAAAAGEIALRTSLLRTAAARDRATKNERRLAFLTQVSETLSVTRDAEAAVGALAGLVVPLLADWCLVSVLDETTGARHDIGRVHRDPDQLAALNAYADLHVQTEQAPIPTAVRTRTPVILPFIDQATVERSLKDPQARAALRALDAYAAAVFPLQGHGAPFAAIALYNRSERGAHTPGELALAQETARRAGLLLENARLTTRQVRLAEELQLSLLTAPPTVAGMELAVRYQPASEGGRVGGDWYDALVRPDGTIVLVIGDVVGHDMRAIGLMGQFRTMTRTIAWDGNSSPAGTLSRVDEACSGLGVDSLCTALVLHLDPSSATAAGVPFVWSSAGHPGPLAVRADGSPIDVRVDPQLLLGVDATTTRMDHAGLLPPGATLLLMTDGLFERRDEALAESVSTLGRALASVASRPLEDACDALLSRRPSGSNDDDVALLALRVADHAADPYPG